MSRVAQFRFTADMDSDAEVIRGQLVGQGIGSSLADVIRLSLRQLRARIDAGLPLIDATLAMPAAAEADRKVDRRKWTEAEEKALGKAPDKDVAAKLDRPVNAVGVRRRALGIPKYEPPPPKAKNRKK